MRNVIIGIFIPLLGTTIGASMVFFIKNEMKVRFRKMLLGFASGVMMAASVWSLLIPALEMAEAHGSKISWLPAGTGFIAGVLFLLILDKIIPHLHVDATKPEGKQSKIGKSLMLILAVTLHNIPEGMAVGVVFAGMLNDNATISLTGALALAIGIAIQNVPEGAVISMPLISNGLGKKRAFGYGFMSGVVEPIGSIIMILLTGFIKPALPFILAFAAGAMIYVVVEELIPESQEGDHSDVGTVGVAVGFVLMMILDVALG